MSPTGPATFGGQASALLNDVLAGAVLHLALLLRRPLELVTLVTTPLLTLILTSVFGDSARADLLPAVVIGSGVMGLWVLVLGEASEVADAERGWGTAPMLMAAPASSTAVLVGRLGTATLVGVITGLEAVFVGSLLGISWQVARPVTFAVGAVLAVTAVTATGLLLAPLFLVSRVGMLFEIVLIYPFYILGTVAFPVTELPGWAQALSHLVFLRWALALLRQGLGAEPSAYPGVATAALLGLAAAAALGGWALLRRTDRRLRRLGTADHV